MHKKPVRYLSKHIKEDLTEKMLFLGGPRQVGKTTLAKTFIQSEDQYFNWDFLEDKKAILRNELPINSGLLVLDEIHKYKNWRSLLKGIYDKSFPKTNFLITGSARLDHFRKGGDSLAGRYHYLRLHPFTLPELSIKCESDLLKDLLHFGGFPEPLFKQNTKHLKRWQNERAYNVVKQDIADLAMIRDISLVEMLLEILPSKVSAPLSIKNLQTDLSVSPHTVEKWIQLMENTYYCYRLAPSLTARPKAIKKAQKLYLWDWSVLENAGSKFENLVASHLLKYCHFHEDTSGDRMELRYIRDTEGRELDFLVLKNKKFSFAVECKSGERELSKAISYYQTKYKIPKIYQVHLGKRDFGNQEKGGRCLPFSTFCIEEEMV